MGPLSDADRRAILVAVGRGIIDRVGVAPHYPLSTDEASCEALGSAAVSAMTNQGWTLTRNGVTIATVTP